MKKVFNLVSEIYLYRVIERMAKDWARVEPKLYTDIFMPKFHGINPRTTLLSYHKSCLISYICEFMLCLLCALRYALWLLQCVDIFISSSFIGTPLSLMCTKVKVCMYLCIFGHSQWIRACMRSNKTLWYCCKRHGDCNCESLRHTHRCLKTTKETASEENKQIN